MSRPFINGSVSILNDGLLSVDETAGSEELVVPSDELSVDGVVVGDEFSVCDSGEVKVGVNIGESLFNNAEDAVDTGFVGVLLSNSKILLISSEPEHDII